MAVFLKGGPWFIIPSQGLLAGIMTWRFLILILILIITVFTKFLLMNYSPFSFIYYTCSICAVSFFLALISLYDALKSWKTLCKVASTYPAILLLPMFSYFTFGAKKTSEGEVGLILFWKWTAINIVISSIGTIIRLILYLEDIQIASLCPWVAYPQLLLFIVIGCISLAILLTILLAHLDLQYGVILPSKLAIPHVLNNGAVVPLVRQSPPGFSRKSIRRTFLVAIKWFVALIFFFSFVFRHYWCHWLEVDSVWWNQDCSSWWCPRIIWSL